MPHLRLEYTKNIKFETGTAELFQKIHQALDHEAGINIENCKSRAIPITDFYLGSGGELKAFVHLDIRFLEGRTNEFKKKLGQMILEILQQYFGKISNGPELQITVEIKDIIKEFYFKYPSNTFSKQI